MYAEKQPHTQMTSADQITQTGEDDPFPELPEPGEKWQLKKLTPKHKDICAMIAQGIGRQQIAAVCKITPEYVTMLTKQPVCIAYIKEMNEFAGLQLEASFSQVVEVIQDVMKEGSGKEKLAAARLQLEVTGRVGSKGAAAGNTVNADDRLVGLAERLVGLLAGAKAQSVATIDQEIEDGDFTEVRQPVDSPEGP